jgi:hypothetical protein
MLAATIMLAYTLARYVDLPERELAIQLPGLYLSVLINEQTVVALVMASLMATGADWLVRGHPAYERQRTLEHWLLPALTAWAIGLPLFQLPNNPLWWIGFILGGLLLILVLIAEYIVVDPDDLRYPLAAAGLTAVSFTLYLVLAAALRFAELRLVMLLPPLALAGGLVGLRALHLRLHGRWAFLPAGLVALVTAQLAAGLHYWPLSPVSFGLALLGPAYALTTLLGNLAEGEPVRQAVVEPITVLFLVWGAAFWVR